MKDLVSLLKDFNPTELHNEEIRCECLERDNHTDGSGKMSMFLSQDKNTYHCFSCGAKGRLTALLQKKFDLDLYDAVEYVSLDNMEYDKYERDKEAVKWATEEVKKIPFTINPHKSFLDRGFTRETLEHFKVGHYEEAGKLVHTVPLFQGRRLMGVKYRQDLPDRSFWYSKGFDRRNFLYNEPSDKKEVILVEGESDTWRSYQNNKKNVCASLGTQVNEEQIKRLIKFDRVLLAFDHDFAGSVATEKVYRALKDHTEVLFMPYDADDPGSCNAENWEFAYTNCSDYLSYQLAMFQYMPEEYEAVLERVNKKEY